MMEQNNIEAIDQSIKVSYTTGPGSVCQWSRNVAEQNIFLTTIIIATLNMKHETTLLLHQLFAADFLAALHFPV